MDLAIENFVSLNSPIGSASNSLAVTAMGLSSLWSLNACIRTGCGQMACTCLPQVNDTENVQEEMLFSFESETCSVLHIFSPLSLMRVIEASSETLLLMQQGAHVSCRKLIGMREWAHSATCASFTPNSIRLFSIVY